MDLELLSDQVIHSLVFRLANGEKNSEMVGELFIGPRVTNFVSLFEIVRGYDHETHKEKRL